MSPEKTAQGQLVKRASFRDYMRIARFDHATKHIFVIPGIVLAVMLRGVRVENIFLSTVIGFAVAISIASANYVINEYLDREFDRHHPTKSLRTAVQTNLKASYVVVEWAIFVAIGLGLAYLQSRAMFYIAAIFASQGIFYNVPPLRTKDKAYFDVISESINNPLRLAIGWAIIDPTSLPPGSLILTYWFGGAFLMAAKRLSEYRESVADHGVELLVRYRASFRTYTEVSLTASCLSYALASTAFIAIFLIKYRIEYLLVLPLIIMLFVAYFVISCQSGSTAQKPERLFHERGLMAITAALALTFLITSYVSIPWLNSLAEQHYILVK